MESFESIIPVFSDVELFLGTFPKDKNIQNAALGLTVATLEAIEAAIGFFLRNEGNTGQLASKDEKLTL